MAYIQYSEQQKEQARRTDLCELLRSQGEQLKRSGSEKVTIRGNKPSSTPEYSFHWSGKSDRLYLFEAPIDMLSYTPCTRTDGNSTAMPPPAVSRIGCCFKCCVTIRASRPSASASTTMTAAERQSIAYPQSYTRKASRPKSSSRPIRIGTRTYYIPDQYRK